MTLDNVVKKYLAPRGECGKETYHDILHLVCRTTSTNVTDQYHFLRCRGYDSVSMAHNQGSGDFKDITYYPSPVARVLPDWMFDFELIGLLGGESELKELMIGQLLHEFYAAVRGGQYRLATMGIRSVLERVIIANVGDHHSFSKNLEQFSTAGYISLMQRDAL